MYIIIGTFRKWINFCVVVGNMSCVKMYWNHAIHAWHKPYSVPKWIWTTLASTSHKKCTSNHDWMKLDTYIFIKKDDSDVVLTWVMMLFHFQVGLKSICNSKTCITRFRRPPKTTTSFSRRWTPWMDVDKSASTYLPQGSHTIGQKYPVHLDTPTIIGWLILYVLLRGGGTPLYILHTPTIMTY